MKGQIFTQHDSEPNYLGNIHCCSATAQDSQYLPIKPLSVLLS